MTSDENSLIPVKVHRTCNFLFSTPPLPLSFLWTNENV